MPGPARGCILETRCFVGQSEIFGTIACISDLHCLFCVWREVWISIFGELDAFWVLFADFWIFWMESVVGITAISRLRIFVMDEPVSSADEEGEGLGDGEIVHRLGVDDKRELVHGAIQPVLFAHVGTRPHLSGRDPAALFCVERMLRRGLDLFAIYRQVHDHRVGVLQDRGDRILPGRAGARIERPDEGTDLQPVNRLLAIVRRGTFRRSVADINRRGAAFSRTPPIYAFAS